VGLGDPKTQKATAFYVLLGALVGDIWHRGIHKWNLIALVLLAGVTGIRQIVQTLVSASDKIPPD